MIRKEQTSQNKRVCICGLVFYLVLFAFSTARAQAAELNLLTHSSLEQTEYDRGQLRGKQHAGRRAYYVELIRELALNLEQSPKILNVPFALGFYEVKNKQNVAFFNVTRVAQREELVKWVIPLLKNSYYFYDSSLAPTGVKSLEEARKLDAIGVLRGGIHETQLREYGFANLMVMDSYTQIFTMLKKGRIALTITTDIDAIPNNDEFKRTSLKAYDLVGYLCFSNDVEDEQVLKWQQAFEQMKSSGKLAQLQSSYLIPQSGLNF